MKTSTRKYLNIVLLSVWIAVLTTACARGSMVSDKNAPTAPIIMPEPPKDDPTGNGPDTGHDSDINSGHDNSDDTADLEPDVDDVKPVDPVPDTNTGKPTIPDYNNITKIDTTNFQALSWERKYRVAKEWSQMVYTVIQNEEPDMLNKNSAKDAEFFCPTYRSLTRAQRLNFWGEFFSALTYPESGWKPTSQMYENMFTTDPVTKEKVYRKDPVTQKQIRSEGLLQLSYQDERNYGINCGFDWEKDKVLADKDPKKTILDPYLNLRCGIKIMAIQLRKKKSITLKTNVYWAVIKIGGKYDKIAQIAKSTKSLKICQKTP